MLYTHPDTKTALHTSQHRDYSAHILTQRLLCTYLDTAYSMQSFPMDSMVYFIVSYCTELWIQREFQEKKFPHLYNKEEVVRVPGPQERRHSVKLFVGTASHKERFEWGYPFGFKKLFSPKTSDFKGMLFIPWRIQPYEDKCLAKLST